MEAGAQRNDPKEMAGGTTYPTYWGPQGDILYVDNYVRCVRDVSTASHVNSIIKPSFNVFPNPAKNQIVIISEYPLKAVSISNLAGVIVAVVYSNDTEIVLNTSTLPDGIYFVNVETNDGTVSVRKTIISK